MKNTTALLLLFITILSCQNDKTAFLNNKEVVDNFNLLKNKEAFYKEAEDSLKLRIEKIVSESGYQDLVQKYQTQRGIMSNAEEEQLYNQIMQLQQSINQQQQFASQELQQRKAKSVDSIIGFVKSYVKDYGKENGYTYIFGDNDSGGMLYGSESLDITEEIIEGLNKKYPTETKVETEETTTEDSNEK
jgi:outer membrane protein